MKLGIGAAAAASLLLIAGLPADARQAGDPSGTAEQRQAVAALDFLDGEWVGEATVRGPGGVMTLTQTERVGSMLGGWIKVIEGRGYDAAGDTRFNAMAVVFRDEATDSYRIHSWAQGRSGDFPFERTDNGFRWSTPAGPGATMRFEAVIEDGRWRETGDYVADGQPPVRVIEMNLRRVGDSDWPAGAAVSPVRP